MRSTRSTSSLTFSSRRSSTSISTVLVAVFGICLGILRAGRGLRGLLCLSRERRKRRRARDGELRESLAIEQHACVLETVDELPVGEPVLARGGIDADDPQPPEVALPAAAA